MTCGNCGAESRSERRFCLRCGAALARPCPTCGVPNEPAAAFCGECGSALASSPTAGADSGLAETSLGTAESPVAERRLVSVLFADLVGFTTLSERRDAEETRELLGRYFETARDVVDRYGGTIEKFIGDAVMAVWGTPTTHEDDAERAVRAALDLLAGVAALGEGAGEAIAARAGVMTGEAAVTIGASGQGMVAGDLVNTASRLQSAAPPGTVLAGEATYRAASGAITFEPAGEQLLRGKAVPVPAWRPTAVVGRVRGGGRPDRIEPPFVGRESEFQLLKDLIRSTTREHRARLVSIVGVGGIGKSRLAWELEKYLDGVIELVYWHRGRSPAYGEGVTFWALGEMVRRRAGVAETDDEPTALAKLESTLVEFVVDVEERRWIAPRLRALLGLEPGPTGARDELFAAWRRFFELVAARATVVLVFEDLHWADAGMFDFIESVLEWSRTHSILIVTLARPEVFDRRPSWGAGQRNFTAVHLEPLAPAMIGQLVRGVAPTLPDGLVQRVVDRADGIPLYAVETIRMLIDAGHLVSSADGYRPVGEIPAFDVPESLQGLIAARLDVLDPPDRSLLQIASVLGLTFTVDGLAAVIGEPAATLEPRLRALIRRELLELDVDPRSPERGQYGFVQSLIREVAYGTLARRDRRSRHLAAARYFEALGDDELAGILATHYLEAYRASPAGPEADAVAIQARIALEGAAGRARALGSPEQALGFLELAIGVATDEAERARLWEAAAEAALAGLQSETAERHVRRAIDAHGARDDRRGTASATALLGQILLFNSRVEPALEALHDALAALPEPGADAAGVRLLAMLARGEMFNGNSRAGLEWSERGLEAAAALDLVPETADLLITRSWALSRLGRVREAIAGLQGTIEMARDHGLTAEYIRAANNLATMWGEYEPRRALAVLVPAAEAAERIGHRDWVAKLAFRSWIAIFSGDWDLAAATVDAHLRDDLPLLSWGSLASSRAVLTAWREDPVAALPMVEEIRRRLAGGTEQDRWALNWAVFEVALAAGDLAPLSESAARLAELGDVFGDAAPGWYCVGVAAGLTGDRERAREALAGLDVAQAWSEAVVGYRRHVAAILAALEGRPREATVAFAEAADIFARAGTAWNAAIAELDSAVLLGLDDPAGRAAADAIRRRAVELGAPVLVQRLEARLAMAARTAPETVKRELDQPAGVPQNARTTS